MTLFYFLLTLILVSYFLYIFLYSSEARIKRLWKEIFKYASRVGELKKNEKADVLLTGQMIYDLESRQDRAGKLINAILEYEYPNLEDEEEEKQEYVSENKYEVKHTKN